MGIYIYDETIPLDFSGLEVKEYQGHTIAQCPGCNMWVAINKFYHADRKVLNAIPHKAPCAHYENFFREGKA